MRDKMTRLWLHGLLELCLLGLLAERRDYGLGLTNRLSEAGLGHVPGGTIYPALARLEATGMVSSAREPSTSGPPRKYFELTGAGRHALDEGRAEWRAFSRSMHAVLGAKELT
jgi:PadR family transcriptional regulator, regulatory protein PadR